MHFVIVYCTYSNSFCIVVFVTSSNIASARCHKPRKGQTLLKSVVPPRDHQIKTGINPQDRLCNITYERKKNKLYTNKYLLIHRAFFLGLYAHVHMQRTPLMLVMSCMNVVPYRGRLSSCTTYPSPPPPPPPPPPPHDK